MGGHSEGQFDIHTAGVPFYRRVDELLHLGKVNNIIKLFFNFRFCHAKNGAIHIHVFPPGQLRMKARAHLQHTGDPAVVRDRSFCWSGHAGQQFEKRRLPCTVVSNDSDSFSCFYGKTHVVQCQEAFVFGICRLSNAEIRVFFATNAGH